MSKIAIIGVGNVGSTTAYTLVQQEFVNEIVLFDRNTPLLDAEKIDLEQGQVDSLHHTTISIGTAEDFDDTDVIIFSAGDITIFKDNPDRFAELSLTKEIAREWGERISKTTFNGILLSITNPCDVITQLLQQVTGLPKHKVLGTGTSLDTSRMKHEVGGQLNIHPRSIEGFVLGEHGETQFVPWSLVRIAGKKLTEFIPETNFDLLEQSARLGGWTILQGKGYTSYGIAQQASRIVQAILSDQHAIIPVSVYDEDSQIYIGQPALIGREGVLQNYDLTLSESEKIKWQHSVKRIKEMFDTI